MGKILDLLFSENWEQFQRVQLYKKLGKQMDELTSLKCDVCGNKRNIYKILGKCVRCGKIVCKSWSTNCGQKVLISFPHNFPAGIYCKECINKPILIKKK